MTNIKTLRFLVRLAFLLTILGTLALLLSVTEVRAETPMVFAGSVIESIENMEVRI